jgi:hypothetical protein
MVMSITNPSAIFVSPSPSSSTSLNSSSIGSVTSFLVILQPRPSGFILLWFPNPSMVNQHAGSLTRYLEFWGKGDEDVEQHLFLCETIWRSRRTLYENKLVDFQTTLRGWALKWYMKAIESGAHAQAYMLTHMK